LVGDVALHEGDLHCLNLMPEIRVPV